MIKIVSHFLCNIELYERSTNLFFFFFFFFFFVVVVVVLFKKNVVTYKPVSVRPGRKSPYTGFLTPRLKCEMVKVL